MSRSEQIPGYPAKLTVIYLFDRYILISLMLIVIGINRSDANVEQISDRLHPRRHQSQVPIFLTHKQNLLTGSASSPISSPYNQFYLTNSVNSPHNGK